MNKHVIAVLDMGNDGNIEVNIGKFVLMADNSIRMIDFKIDSDEVCGNYIVDIHLVDLKRSLDFNMEYQIRVFGRIGEDGELLAEFRATMDMTRLRNELLLKGHEIRLRGVKYDI